jgi:hypothetical protein
MEYLDKALWMVLAAIYIGGMIWWGRRTRDKDPHDRTSSGDGWDGDGD